MRIWMQISNNINWNLPCTLEHNYFANAVDNVRNISLYSTQTASFFPHGCKKYWLLEYKHEQKPNC